MNHRLPGILTPLSHITTEPFRFSAKPPSPVYTKTTINHLKSLTGLHISPGLTNQEISAVESSLGFSFPLDLRLILQKGLPVGPHFPNWRTGSNRNYLLLPLLHVTQLVVKNGFWVDTWGTRPGSDSDALSLVKKLIEIAPVLVPVYGDFYVPSTTPNLAGNPVFKIDGDGVKVLSCDVAGFLQGLNGRKKRCRKRRVEFWSDVAERGRLVERENKASAWWSASGFDEGLSACLEDAFWKLRGAGWKEDEVREMMLMDGGDQKQVQGDVVYVFDGELGDVVKDTCTETEDCEKGSQVTTLRQLLLSDGWVSLKVI